VDVGVVQGNVPGRGLDPMGRMRSVTNNHLAETVNLETRARLGLVPDPDFVLWPESSTDIDPAEDPITARTIQSAADTAGVPVFVGAVTYGPGPDERQTTGLWWDPRVGGPTDHTPSRTWARLASGSRSGSSCCPGARCCRWWGPRASRAPSGECWMGDWWL